MTDTHYTSNDIIIREMIAAGNDRVVWAEMRVALWPDESPQAHLNMIDALHLGEDAFGFIAQALDGTPCGFAEVAVRKYANGCETMPVPFLEGIWVKEQFRRQGIGRRLIEHIEAFLAARGFSELGSDTQIDNCVSQAAHLAWEFLETERVVYFRKILKAAVY